MDKMKCRFPDCEREALSGWTMCARHYTAGMARRIWNRIVKNEAKRRRF